MKPLEIGILSQESIAQITENKDVQKSFFFISNLICYFKIYYSLG